MLHNIMLGKIVVKQLLVDLRHGMLKICLSQACDSCYVFNLLCKSFACKSAYSVRGLNTRPPVC